MKTVEQIMGLATILGDRRSLATLGINNRDQVQDAYKKLRTAIEELVADAEKWREYKARKDAVIAAGMGRNPLRDTATCDTYGVINGDGEVEYSAYWPEACHDHIKDMQIEHGMGSKWKVRALKYLPVTTTRKEST